jgi:hypothetical protein
MERLPRCKIPGTRLSLLEAPPSLAIPKIIRYNATSRDWRGFYMDFDPLQILQENAIEDCWMLHQKRVVDA